MGSLSPIYQKGSYVTPVSCAFTVTIPLLPASCGMSMHQPTRRALVLFSGGQDSTTCLAWALARYGHVETVGFNYGQRHGAELDCRSTLRHRLAKLRPDWAPRLGQDHLLDVDVLRQLGTTAMIDDIAIAMQADG